MTSHDIPCGSCGAVGAYDTGCPECQVPPEDETEAKAAAMIERIWAEVVTNNPNMR